MTGSRRDYYDVLGVPRDADDKTIKDAYHRLAMKWHHESSCRFIFQCLDEAFDDGDAAVLADGSVTWWFDSAAFAPSFETFAPELRALVADKVLRRCVRGANCAAEESTDGLAGRLLGKHGHSHAMT